MMLENFVLSDNVRLRTAQTGHGSPVMLGNGGPGCCDYLAPVAEMLEDIAGVICFEQRGCGRSVPAPVYDIETCLRDLENIRRHYSVEQFADCCGILSKRMSILTVLVRLIGKLELCFHEPFGT